MKKLNLIPKLLLILIIAGCGIPYSHMKHSDTPYHTKGSYRIGVSIEKLVRKRYGGGIKPITLVVNGTMPANEFIDTSATYKDKLVSYSVMLDADDSDMVHMVWDYQPSHFGIDAAPSPLLFPYPQQTEYTNNRYYIKYVLVDDFQKAKPEHVWDNSNLIKGVKLKDIRWFSISYIEKKGGFISQNYPELYYNGFSSLGIIHEAHLTDGRVVKLYMITSDLYNNTSPHYVRWKIKV
jgi:hypothetical protein